MMTITGRCGVALAVVGMMMWTGAAWALDLAEEKPVFEQHEVFEGKRFPNIVVATDGTVLAFRAQDGPIELRRSEDGGQTWGSIIQVGSSKALMGAAVVDDTTGDVIAFHGNNKMYRSRDHGRTWELEQTTIKPNDAGGVGNMHGADSGITLHYGEHRGRLILPARVLGPKHSNDQSHWPYHYNAAIFSDDHGRTWQTSHPFPVLGTGEGTLTELADGTLYYNSRVHMADDARRRVAWSRDGGMTWINPTRADELPDGMRATAYGCMGGLVRLPIDGHDILIYSNLDSDRGHDRWLGRERITVWASFDGGRTWPVKRLVDGGPSAYSSLAAGRPGTPSEGMIYLLYEGGEGGSHSDIQLARFNLAWLVEGQDWQQHLIGSE